jgi:Family of unknown function (DUF6065)
MCDLTDPDDDSDERLRPGPADVGCVSGTDASSLGAEVFVPHTGVPRPSIEIVLHMTTLSPDLAPTRCRPQPTWWQGDSGTANHAIHCQPLRMINTLGYYIRAPGSFTVSWSGDPQARATISNQEGAGLIVDNHSANASFTVQPGFVPRTPVRGDFLLIKSIPNERRPWFTPMEALIEAWWQPAEFGLVCLVNTPGEHVIARGQPLAQMTVFRAEGGFTTLRLDDSVPWETEEWRERRARPEYRRDMDYQRGRYPDGSVEPTHIRNWRRPGDR